MWYVPKDLRVAKCEFDTLNLQHKLREAFAAVFVADSVGHRALANREVLQQHQWIVKDSVCTKILHLRLNFILLYIEIVVL